MTERLLQFIWQFQHYNNRELNLVTGEQVVIIHQGIYNTNQGPDFLQARIKIDATFLAGNIELHVRTSDWQKHRHSGDKNYQNVILHVVWEDDATGLKKETMPLLVLQNRVPGLLIRKYEQWMNQVAFIPCSEQLREVNELIWIGWKDRLLAERFLRASHAIQQNLKESTYHWEETFWWQLAHHFGASVNGAAFESLAKSIPYTILQKAKTQIHQLEALLFGQAGLLNKTFTGEYPRLLFSEYQFLKKKYTLQPICEQVYFLRMRPVNFPTVRIAQLSMLLHLSKPLFAQIREINDLKKIKKMFAVTANDYWHYHYLFEEEAACKPKNIGVQMIERLIINVVCPMLFAYGIEKGEPGYKIKAFNWLKELAAEKNAIIREFDRLTIKAANACDSQSLLELKIQYCDHKRCLDCSIGHSILKNSTP